MPVNVAVTDANTAVIAKAARYITAIDTLIHARYDISFEGFGTGGTAGVTAEHAQRYLRSLGSRSDPHHRYGTPLVKITVKVRIPDTDFTP